MSSSPLTAEPEPPRDPSELRANAGVCAQLGVSLQGYPLGRWLYAGIFRLLLFKLLLEEYIPGRLYGVGQRELDTHHSL